MGMHRVDRLRVDRATIKDKTPCSSTVASSYGAYTMFVKAFS